MPASRMLAVISGGTAAAACHASYRVIASASSTRSISSTWRAGFMRGSSIDPPAIDDMDGAGGEAGLVAREVKRERGDLFGAAEPSHRLALDEALARCCIVAGVVQALLERWRVDRARADRIAANAL